MDDLPEKWTWAKFSSADSTRWTSLLYQRRRVILAAMSALAGILLLFLVSSLGPPQGFASGYLARGSSATHNRTLGFQKVFAIGLPSRTDKRDALTLTSSFSNFDITWSDGVNFDDMNKKAIPPSFDRIIDKDWAPHALGCWRAHLNVLTKMVHENIATALILEDDADWDISLKYQLEQFGKGLTELQSDLPSTSPRASPYGHNWDLLWLGQCWGGPADGAQNMYFIHNDTTVPPVTHRSVVWWNNHILPEVLSNDTRIIYRAAETMCALGYAMTLEGARKALTALSLRGGVGDQVDFELANMCKNSTEHAMSLNCYGIHPHLFGAHRFAGSSSRDSDIWFNSEDDMHNEYTLGITYSTMLNAPRLLNGTNDALSQWPEETPPTRRLDEDYARQVWGERRLVDLGTIPVQSVPGINAGGVIDPEQLDGILLPP